jgi:hypothetical protein
MYARRRSFQPRMDCLQERIAPVSLIYTPPVRVDLSMMTTTPVSTAPLPTCDTELMATSPVSTSG